MHRTSCKVQREGGNASMCVRDGRKPRERMERESRWRWGRKWRGWSESEKEMTSLRKCWAGFEGYWMKEVYSHSAPSLSLSLSRSPSSSPSHEMYSAGRVPIPTRLVNGRGVEYFKQPFTRLLFPPYSSLSLPLPFFFFLARLCISQVHTWPCFCYCSPHLESAWHHAVFLGLVGWVAV